MNELNRGEEETDSHDPNGKTILLVEDESFVRSVMQEVLEMEGYRVIAAENAAEALELSNGSGDLDLLLTDVVLPGMNGRDLAKKLVGQNRDLRVILMSGYSDNRVSQGGLEGVSSQFLQKPFTLETLVARIAEVLAHPNSEERLKLPLNAPSEYGSSL